MTKKFRIWDNNQNKYRDSSGELRLSRTFETFCLGLHFQRESLDDSPWVSDLEIEQFTGLLDSQGKEIYEGDAVLFQEKKWEVKFKNFSWFLVNDLPNKMESWWLAVCDSLKVIGNIHQNPKLLK